MIRRLFNLAAFALSCVCCTAQGTVVFDNFLPNNGFNENVAAGITFITHHIAFPFTPQVTGTLRTIELPLFHVDRANAADISIRATDPVSGFPGVALETFHERGGLQPATAPGKQPVTYISSLTPVLTAGTPYWLEVAEIGDSSLAWHATGPGNSMPGYIGSIDGQFIVEFSDPSAFRITVDLIPEPKVLSFICAGLVIFTLNRRSQKL